MAKRRSHGQIVNTNHSNGRTVTQMWVWLFRENERRAREGERPWTDDELTGQMLLAFPNRFRSAVFFQVARVRNRYNRGTLTTGRRPRVQSVRYEEVDGRIVPVSARGRPLGKEFLRKRRYLPKNRPSEG